MAFDCQELLRSILDPETTHTLYDGQWMMVVDDGVMVVVGCHTPTNGGNIGMRRSVKIARDIITLIIVTSI